MQLHTYVEGRLGRWSYWVTTSLTRGGPRRVTSWWGPMVLDRNVEQIGRRRTLRIDPTEAEETELAVRALPCELRDAVIQAWTKGGTNDQKAKACGCCRETFWRRLQRANVKLLGYMNDIAADIPLPEPEPIKKYLTVRNSFPNIPATVA